MDDVDIILFRADYDLTMHMFFLNAQGFIYARYGIRKDGKSETVMSVEGVRDAMRKTLDIHKRESTKAPPPWKPVETQDLVSFKKDPRRPNGCLHCHHAGYYVRKEEFSIGRLNKETVWGFPLPDNIGLSLEIDKNTLVKEARDPAAKAGIRAGDRVVALNGQRVVTPADITWILNAFKGGTLRVAVEREGKTETFSMELKGSDLRKTDISWRQSWWDSGPDIGLDAAELSPEERKPRGISPDALALRVTCLSPGRPAAAAGVKVDDVIVSVDGRNADMEGVEFQMYLRLTRRVGDTVPLVLLRGTQRAAINVKLK